MGVCSSCGHANEPGARFCSACGALLAAQVEAAAEERKIVTVLFVDLVGFTSQAEQLDPEDVRALLTPYFAHVRAELERFGGTVEKFIGDAVLGLFGAPVAHEDDPERAVRAALAIRDLIRGRDGVKVRIGVNTGEALVSLGARPSSGEGMVAGDVVNTGARLQAAAPVNGVLVGERTYRATRHVIDYADAEPVTAKGKERPVPVWVAVAPRARLGVDVPHEARTPLVGRDHELAVIRDVLARVLDQRAPQLLTLVGTPGVGKSRLLYELSVFVNAQPELISWRQGRSLPYGEGVSFWSLAEMVKAHAGIHDTDSPAEVDARLAQMVADDVPAAADADWMLRHLRRLVRSGGADETYPLDRDESFAAWRGFFEALAETKPLVLVFEDLHWADDGLLDFVDHLGDWLVDLPVLIVCSARPELLARRPEWAGGKPNAITVSLSPLTDEETTELFTKLLGAGGPDVEWGTIVARAGGNPLYAEQYASLLTEMRGSANDLPLPETVQGIIGARLDSLDLSDKRLLQHAAVLGKVFWPGAIGALGDDTRSGALEGRLQDLGRKQFIRRDRSSSVTGQNQYAFLHILVRDVAYGQLPRATRIDKHLAAAAWIESIGAAEEFGDMLAHHYLAALELARTTERDVSDIVNPARAAVRAAGERAYALGALTVAVSHFETALSLCADDDPHEHVVLLFLLARAKSDAGLDPGNELLTEASEGLRTVGEPTLAAEAEARLSRAWSLRGDRDRATHHLARAQDLVRGSAPSVHKAVVLAEVARYHLLAGGGRGESAARESLELAELLGRDDLRANALTTLGVSRVQDGDVAGIAMIREAVDCAEAGHYAVPLLRGRNNLAYALDVLAGDKLEAMRITRESEALALRMGNASAARWAHASIIGSRFEVGDWNGCERTIDAFLAESAADPSYQDAYMYAARAVLRVARDDIPGAIDDTRSSINRGNQAKDPQLLLPVLGAGAYVLFEAGRVDESDALLSELLAHDLYDRRHLGSSIIDCVRAADLLDRREEMGRWLGPGGAGAWLDVADDYLAGAFSEAAEKLDALAMRWPAAHAHLRAARVLGTDGDRDQANGHLHAALAFFEAVGATHYIRQAVEGLRI